MIDCQQETSHLASLGAIPIPREEFVKKMQALAGQPEISDWKPLQLFDRRENDETFAST
jgi:leucyl/phenylalanyl-tRNA--protein transferase